MWWLGTGSNEAWQPVRRQSCFQMGDRQACVAMEEGASQASPVCQGMCSVQVGSQGVGDAVKDSILNDSFKKKAKFGVWRFPI